MIPMDSQLPPSAAKQDTANRSLQQFLMGNVLMLGSVTMAAIMAMAVVRCVRQEYGIAIADAVISALIGLALWYARRTGRAAQAGTLLVAIHSIGACTITLMFGHYGTFWVFLVVVTNYFLITAESAFIVNAVLLLIVSLDSDAFGDIIEIVSFLITSVLVSCFTYIFASRSNQKREQLEAYASIDALTGIQNRRALEAELSRITAEHARRERSCGLILIDLDHFKLVNDRFGHNAGDQVLLQFSRVIEQHKRAADQLYRLGGEEFVLLAYDVDADQLTLAADRLMDVIRNKLKSPAGKMTASIGTAMLRKSEHWRAWLERADEALYAAKSAGRDQIKAWI
jgi:diguanylate cyclase